MFTFVLSIGKRRSFFDEIRPGFKIQINIYGKGSGVLFYKDVENMVLTALCATRIIAGWEQCYGLQNPWH